MGLTCKIIIRTVLSIVLFAFILNPLICQMDSLIIKHSEDFEVTGLGDAEHWGKTTWVNIPQRGKDQISYNTKVKILYSATGIYFLFDCEDKFITSTITEDFGDLYNEDVVEVFFWTDENYPFYFEYELSPTNYELPIFVPNVEGDFFGWRPWHYEGVRRTRRATFIHRKDNVVTNWTAEFFIPFALLKPMSNVPPVSGTKWRANMYRLDYDNGQTRWEWQPIRTNFHDFERFGSFVFE